MTIINIGPGALDDTSIPDYVGVDAEGIMRIFGWTNRTSINKNLGKRIPPSLDCHRYEWTIGQLRDWRMKRGLLANQEADRRARECARIIEAGSMLEKAALS